MNTENVKENVDKVVETEFTENDSKLEDTGVVSTDNSVVAENETEPVPAAEFVDKKDDKDDKDDTDDKDDANDDADDKNDADDKDDKDDDDDDKDAKAKYTALEESYNQLKANFDTLEQEVASLREFKLAVENEKKDALINQFYMLSDEDKKDVIENKSSYSLEEIESKLAVICFKKKVNFNLDDSSENEDSTEDAVVATYNIQASEDSVPDWVKEVELNMNKY